MMKFVAFQDLTLFFCFIQRKRATPPTASQFNPTETVAVAELPIAQRSWSIQLATTQATQTQLPQATQYLQNAVNYGLNLQQSALKDFLSLYTIVRDDTTQGAPTAGSRSSLAVGVGLSDGQKARIRTALFGDGTRAGALINQVLLGGSVDAGQNPLTNIGNALTNLGVTNRPSRDHQNHFHVYLKPPSAETIGDQALMAEQNPVNINAAQYLPQTLPDELRQPVTTDQEMLMFDYFIPPQWSIDPPALIAEAAKAQPLVTKPKTMCWDIGSTQPVSAMHQFTILKWDDATKLARAGYGSASYQVTLLEAPVHGKVGEFDKWDFEVGVPTQMFSVDVNYKPKQDYIGKDRAVFLVNAFGKQYKVTVNFWVQEYVYDVPGATDFCKSRKFSSAIDFPITVSSSLRNADLSALLAAASRVSYSFTDLPGTALGQTTGEGATAAITLDQNAAGHGWYIDPTPLDTTDDYLPTSNPEVWQAKAGSAAAGKMDMLSVLLHEYGHALGLEHSGDASNYMAASLQPGQRKLPSADELALMARLVAELKGDGSGQQDPANPFTPSPLSVLGLLPMAK